MRPTDFAAQLNVSLANGWGIVRTVTDMCMKMPEGKYVLVKDPNKVMSMTDCRSSRPLVPRASNHLSVAQLILMSLLNTAGDPSILRSISGIHE